jgi:hypothetical protein
VELKRRCIEGLVLEVYWKICIGEVVLRECMYWRYIGGVLFEERYWKVCNGGILLSTFII